MVNHGIRRIIAMQTVSGGFSFWPSGYDPQSWSSAYAIFVLLEAKKAGFVVPASVLKAALNYLDALPEKSGFVYYALARGGALQKRPEMIDRLITLGKKEDYDALTALWIAGTVHESGKATEALQLLDIALKKQPSKKRQYHDDFYSQLQLLGMRFYMTQLVNPESPVINDLVIELATALAGKLSYHYTTQELAWTMLSLGMYAEKKGLKDIKATLKLDGKEVKAHTEKGLVSWTLYNVANHNSVVLETNSDAQLFLNIENTGFSKTKRAFERYAKGIRLWRTFFNYSGEPVNSIQQGDLVVMKIGMKADGHYQNVAIEASIPAGLEIENPRLGRDDLPAWVTEVKKLWHPEYVDIKDDRVIIFGSVHSDTLYYFTLARAVTPGNYFLPPTTGIVMYNPELNARTDAGNFKVNTR